MNTQIRGVVALILLMAVSTAFAAEAWKEKLRKELPLLGHRNWIVVADAAYPLQTAAGIETIRADADQTVVVREVLAELAKVKHVKPVIYTDAEMKLVAETSAPGIGSYREALSKIVTNQPVQNLPHEQIISQLDEAGKTFKVLIIKTPMTLPYTSVFLRLECGYWNGESEKKLREAMAKSAK